MIIIINLAQQKYSQYQMYSNLTLNDLEKLRILGEGTYGKCYLVQNKIMNQLCVLKQIEIFGMSQQQEQEVIKQAKILSELDHPSIVRFLSFFKTDSYLNIVMEYADGGDLNKMIKQARGTHFTQNQILNWFTQICLAIKHIHDLKVVHRDLKCQNIFMTKQGLIKLGDFGIAKRLSKTLQKIKTVVGTPYYMSPQICENKDYSFKTDIWSLGVILYQMCALKLPFDGSSLPVLALKISRGQYPALTANYSRDLKILVKNLLQNNPTKRPPISKILQNPLISKRVPQYLPKHILQRQLPQLITKNVLEKQNDQQIFQQSMKDNNSVVNKNDSDIDKRIQVHSARSHNPNSKISVKSPQAKFSQIPIKLKQFSGSSKSGKIQNKKKKVESFKRRQISEPNLAMKKFTFKNDPIQLVKQEQNQEKEDFIEDVQYTLRNIIQQKYKQKTQIKILETSDELGLANQSFCGNGIMSLLWGMQNMSIKI